MTKKYKAKESFLGPCVIVLHEKNETKYMNALTEDDFHRSCLRILKCRFDSGYYLDDQEFSLNVERTLSRKKGQDAWELLEQRSHVEYEYVVLAIIDSRYEIGEKYE
jgi:hypothetical protein